MIDSDGYRPNVGIVICNKYGQNGLGKIRGSFRKEALTKAKTSKQRCTVSFLKKSA